MSSRETSTKHKRSIAILGTRGIPAKYGGFETFAEELSVRLVQRGIDVTVYCEAGDEEQPEMYQGVHLRYVSAPRLGPLTTILFDLLCLWNARKKFDVVYMLGYGSSIFCFIPRLWGTKVWINMDGIEWARSKWGRLARLWLKMMETIAMWTPDRVIADSGGIQEHLRSRHTHLPPIRVIPYGAPVIDMALHTRLLDKWQLVSGKYYLLVCRLEPENSVKEILNGYIRSDSRLPLVVIGGINPATRYMNELLQVSDDRVRFIGPIYDKETLQTMRFHAFAYFHGHTVGGTNPSLLEALGCGNLIIAHDNIFNREVAEEAASYFHRETHIPEIVMAVESYPADKKIELKKMAKERILRHYNWDTVTDAYFILLHEQ